MFCSLYLLSLQLVTFWENIALPERLLFTWSSKTAEKKRKVLFGVELKIKQANKLEKQFFDVQSSVVLLAGIIIQLLRHHSYDVTPDSAIRALRLQPTRRATRRRIHERLFFHRTRLSLPWFFHHQIGPW